ncbi:LysR family transcriptional regulator [Mesorhizobium sp. Cs1321R2N1]|uniref:LysR family transcriptional regulator n=1 Tax=Mesorhizobium sp. Cs1321R2N1 TaxID=3015174 RepID=UPI003FA5C7DD
MSQPSPLEAAERHGSFTRAAEEQSVTQGAASHQVKALEVDWVSGCSIATSKAKHHTGPGSPIWRWCAMPSTVSLGMGANLLGCDRERAESVRSVFGMAALESAFCLRGAAPHWAQDEIW